MDQANNKKFLILFVGGFVAIFLGAFLAFYLLFGQFIRNSHFVYSNDFAEINNFQQSADRLFRDQQRIFNNYDNEFNKFFERQAGFMSEKDINSNNTNVFSIKTNETKDSYKIRINLKPFNNDAKKVDIKIKDKMLSISAKFENKDKDSFNSSSFYQSLYLPQKIDKSRITKEVKNNILTIIIPKPLEK